MFREAVQKAWHSSPYAVLATWAPIATVLSFPISQMLMTFDNNFMIITVGLGIFAVGSGLVSVIAGFHHLAWKNRVWARELLSGMATLIVMYGLYFIASID